VLEVQPRDARAYALRGNCHKHLGDKPRARADYERACALRQTDLDLRMERCRMHAFFESWDELLVDVRPLLSSGPHKEEARTLRALARTRLRAAEMPLHDDDDFMADGPRAVLARIDAMIMRARSGKDPDAFPFYELQHAAEACKDAMRQFPEHAEALKSALNRALVGAAGHAAWDWPGEHALDALAWWIESQSSLLSDPLIFGHLASAYVHQADELCVFDKPRRQSLRRALHYVSVAIALSKGNPQFYDARASIHQSLGNRFYAWLDRRWARKSETKRQPPPDEEMHGEAT
jgi:tetratricopeptide (TPR) repeat protein